MSGPRVEESALDRVRLVILAGVLLVLPLWVVLTAGMLESGRWFEEMSPAAAWLLGGALTLGLLLGALVVVVAAWGALSLVGRILAGVWQARARSSYEDRAEDDGSREQTDPGVAIPPVFKVSVSADPTEE
ncbi:MAG: hypothetical protein JXX28_01410 [Deltaproteobacteria bacterium]|nr:hypothetical protein [Deltaproteobacteria bacterium]